MEGCGVALLDDFFDGAIGSSLEFDGDGKETRMLTKVSKKVEIQVNFHLFFAVPTCNQRIRNSMKEYNLKCN